MGNNCYIFAFATFGHPNDFRQTPLKNNNPDLAKQVKVFDLSNAIKIFPDSTVYSIRKEKIGDSKLISYSIYTFAQEQTSKRDGTFIGSSITFENKLAEEKYVINCLNEFHKKLIEKNLSNGILKVNHSKDFQLVGSISDYDKIENPQIEIKELNYNTNNKNLVVFCNISVDKLSDYFKRSIDLLNIYDTIYLTNSEEVAKFVSQKGIFKLIQNVEDKKDFENEYNNFIQEQQRKREQSISEFEREVKSIKDDKNTAIQEFKTKIVLYRTTHDENDKTLRSLEEEIDKIAKFYDRFLNETGGLMNQLKHNNGKLQAVKDAHNSNKITFKNSLSELNKTTTYITKIPKPKPQSGLHTEQQRQDFKHPVDRKRIVNEKPADRSDEINPFKIISLILLLLLVFTWIFVLYFGIRYRNRINLKSIHKQSFTFGPKKDR